MSLTDIKTQLLTSIIRQKNIYQPRLIVALENGLRNIKADPRFLKMQQYADLAQRAYTLQPGWAQASIIFGSSLLTVVWVKAMGKLWQRVFAQKNQSAADMTHQSARIEPKPTSPSSEKAAMAQTLPLQSPQASPPPLSPNPSAEISPATTPSNKGISDIRIIIDSPPSRATSPGSASIQAVQHTGAEPPAVIPICFALQEAEETPATANGSRNDVSGDQDEFLDSGASSPSESSSRSMDFSEIYRGEASSEEFSPKASTPVSATTPRAKSVARRLFPIASISGKAGNDGKSASGRASSNHGDEAAATQEALSLTSRGARVRHSYSFSDSFNGELRNLEQQKMLQDIAIQAQKHKNISTKYSAAYRAEYYETMARITRNSLDLAAPKGTSRTHKVGSMGQTNAAPTKKIAQKEQVCVINPSLLPSPPPKNTGRWQWNSPQFVCVTPQSVANPATDPSPVNHMSKSTHGQRKA